METRVIFIATNKGPYAAKLVMNAELSKQAVFDLLESLRVPCEHNPDFHIAELIFDSCRFQADAFDESEDKGFDPLAPLKTLPYLLGIKFNSTLLSFAQTERLLQASVFLPKAICFQMSLDAKHLNIIYKSVSDLVNNYSNFVQEAYHQWRINQRLNKEDELEACNQEYEQLNKAIILYKIRFGMLLYKFRASRMLEIEHANAASNPIR